MRHLRIQVPVDSGDRVARELRRVDASNVARSTAEDADGAAFATVSCAVENRAVETLLEALDDVPGLRVTFAPRGVLALAPPDDCVPDEVRDVGARAPIEILLSGIQSVGSWKSFLAYAAAAGVIVFVGLLTDTWYLLTAAMLIAPYASPAMNAALASARGDVGLLARSLARYVAALAVTVATVAAVTFAYDPDVVTDTMRSIGSVSAVAALLPLVAGAAGALHLSQSDRANLVSGAAVGVLVAASLAPPAGILGMGLVLREWGLATSGLFLLALQLVGIHFSGAIVFRIHGVSPKETRYGRGRRGVFPASLAVAALLVASLVVVQLADPVALERGSVEKRIASAIERSVEESGVAAFVAADVRFAGSAEGGAPVVLAVVHVRAPEDAQVGDVETAVASLVREAISVEAPGTVPAIVVLVARS